MALPNDLEKRKRIQSDLDRSIALLNEIDMLQSDLDDIANTLNDEKVMKAKEFKQLVQAKYDGDKLLQKAKSKLAEVEDSIAQVDILDKIK